MASLRADALLANGDLEGHRTWALIVSRIVELGSVGVGAGTKNTRH